MNIHGLKTEKKQIYCFTFKGKSKTSTLDQVTLPPEMGMRGMRYCFGEWLKREGHDWQWFSEEKICRLAVDFWNSYPEPQDLPRRFDRMATTDDPPQLRKPRNDNNRTR